MTAEIKKYSRDAFPPCSMNTVYKRELHEFAVFVCEDNDYFVLNSLDEEYPFLTLACETTADDTRFAINIVTPHKYRDTAISEALYMACNDADGFDSIQERTRLMAPFFQDYGQARTKRL